MQSELERVSDLAKKAAILNGCMYVVYQKEDGTYAFDKIGVEIKEGMKESREDYLETILVLNRKSPDDVRPVDVVVLITRDKRAATAIKSAGR